MPKIKEEMGKLPKQEPKLYARYFCKYCNNEYLELITKDKKVLIKEGYICANDNIPMTRELITR